MERRMCIIKSHFGKSDKVRVFFYELSEESAPEGDVDDFKVNLYYTPFSKHSFAATLPISCIEVINSNSVTVLDNVPYYNSA